MQVLDNMFFFWAERTEADEAKRAGHTFEADPGSRGLTVIGTPATPEVPELNTTDAPAPRICELSPVT
jgi:hypothetical protein